MSRLTDAEAITLAAEINALLGGDGADTKPKSGPVSQAEYAPDQAADAYTPEADLEAFFSRWLPEARAMVAGRWRDLDADDADGAATDLLIDFIQSGQLASYDPARRVPWQAFVRQRLAWAVSNAVSHWLVDAFAYLDKFAVLAEDADDYPDAYEGDALDREAEEDAGRVIAEAPERTERDALRYVWVQEIAQALPDDDRRQVFLALAAGAVEELGTVDVRGVVDVAEIAALTGLSEHDVATALAELRYTPNLHTDLRA